MSSRLTGKQKAFADYWLGEANFNGTKAAKLAGYKAETDSAFAVIASNNLRKVNIRAYIEENWNNVVMGPKEIQGRLTNMARGDIGEFLTIVEVAGRAIATVDLEKVKENGYLIKSLSYTKYGPRIELHDAKSALVELAKMQGQYVDKTANLNLDLSSLSVDQLRRIAKGENPFHVVSSAS